MTEHSDNQNLDLDEVKTFIELVTKNRDALSALGKDWDARWLMLYLVSLANHEVPEGAYLLSKLYARGIIR